MTITKNHNSSQNKLSVNQLNAIDLIIQGKVDQETADIIGVARETVTRWRNDNPYFVAELNRQRKLVWEVSHDKLRGLVSKAVDTLEVAIENGDVKAAIEVLKAVNLYGNVNPPTGEDDPELVLWNQSEKWAETQLAKQGPPDFWANDSFLKQNDKAELARRRMKEMIKKLDSQELCE